jgi:hypothetical protein
MYAAVSSLRTALLMTRFSTPPGPVGVAAWVGVWLTAGGTVWLVPRPALFGGLLAAHAATLSVAAKPTLSSIPCLMVIVRIAHLLIRTYNFSECADGPPA